MLPTLPVSKLIPSLLRILVHPVLGLSIELAPLGPVLVGDTSFDRIIRLGLRENRLDQLEHVRDLVRRLPLVAAQNAQTHGALVVIGDVWMPDLGSEGDGGWLKGVFLG